MMACTLIDLPQEVLGTVLSFLPPPDIIRFGRTCHSSHAFISPSNQLLWRESFLHVYDDPELAWAGHVASFQNGRSGWNWYRELKSRGLAVSISLFTQRIAGQ